MNCPVCKTAVLQSESLEENLVTSSCRACGGQWVKSFQYWKWREAHGRDWPELPPGPAPGPEMDRSPAGSDTKKAKLCPECGRFLTRHPVGHELGFALDRCNHCGGMWFDAGEWEALKRRNLHDDAHLIFTEAWQAQVRHDQARKDYRRLLTEKLGDRDLAEAERIKAWLDAHPQAPTLYAFLLGGRTPEELPPRDLDAKTTRLRGEWREERL